MNNKHYYENRRRHLLKDPAICKENRQLFEDFFAFEEYKLKRVNGLNALDEGTYKTLLEYCSRFRTVNKWFANKPWKDLTEQDIKKVYDDLEDGKITNRGGTPFKNRKTYYNKILKSKPFELAGKADIARKVINVFSQGKVDTEVRFIEMEEFRKLADAAIQPIQKLLMWLAWDIGENVNSLLQLKKCDFCKQTNEETGEPEYRVNLQRAILKRTRRPRGEITNFRETVALADLVLKKLKDSDRVFPFQYRQAKKVFDRAVQITGVRCRPGNQNATWKDLRSGMACHLMKSGWHSDEINARLGHLPSSKELDKYINFLALDGNRPKKKLFDGTLAKVQKELEETKQREKLYNLRVDNQKTELGQLKKELESRRKFDDVLAELTEDPEVVRKAIRAMIEMGRKKPHSRR